MQIKRSIFTPVLVALIAMASGGWFLQRGIAQERNVYFQARLFDEVMHHLSERYVDERDPSDLYKMAIDGMIRELGDPHTGFMTAKDYESLRVQTQGEYGGLGIQIEVRDGWVTVISPLPGTPAERAGLQAGDRIVEVDGSTTRGWSSDDAVGRLRGPKGTPVDLRVARIGVDEPIPFRVVRAEIQVKSVPSAYMLEPGIGYVELTVFSETSTQELREAIAELQGQGMRKLILDMRNNPGGLLDQGVSVSDLFLTNGQGVVEIRGRSPQNNQKYQARDGDSYPGVPVAVLVGPFSASAAEIVAGALQDHDRALVLGETTFGKGSVQTLIPLQANNFLKLTTARWYTPSGRSIQKPTGVDDGRPTVASATADAIEEEAASDDTTGLERFRTAGGRVVFGGGGIRPDLIVRPDTLSLAEQEFARAAQRHGSKFADVLYRFSIQYAREHPELQPGFAVTQGLLDGFYRALLEAGIEVERDAYDRAHRWVGHNVAVEISRAKWGQLGLRRRLNQQDPRIGLAADLLRGASSPQALFQAAERLAATQGSEGGGGSSAQANRPAGHP
jgi:carboxyl-terminal processing protease